MSDVIGPLDEGVERIIRTTDSLDIRKTGADWLLSEEKRIIDQVGAAVLLTAARPLIEMARLAVRLESRGPTVVQLDRVGQRVEQEEQIYKMLKIRTMRLGTEDQPHVPYQKSESDSRITRVGAILRKSSIDELMQLYNVARGDMSLVGPRPETLEEYELHTSLDDDYHNIYPVGRPGITGAGQISVRVFDNPYDRIECVKEELAEACYRRDMDILAKTVGAVILGKNAY